MAKQLTKAQEAKLDKLQKALEGSWDEMDKLARKLVEINDNDALIGGWLDAITNLANAGERYNENHDALYAYRNSREERGYRLP